MNVIIHENKSGESCKFNVENKSPKIEVLDDYKPFANKMKQTIFFKNNVGILAGGTIVSRREADGPFGNFFDLIEDDPKMHEKNFETAEIRMLELAIEKAIEKSGLKQQDIGLFLSGDLLNQLTTSSYVARKLDLPYLGLYSACSTMSQTLAVGAAMVNAGYQEHILCATASHFATAERQFRYPLEYGCQRPPYAQWTVTGAGCTVLSSTAQSPRITSATFGRVADFGICDLSNMGAAMAPAAQSTLMTVLRDTNTKVEDYDLILTGDLGKLGSDILRDLMREQGIELGQRYKDCGAMMFDVTQKCYQGGSGAGCSATILNSYVLSKIHEGKYKKVLFMATGALMSTQSCYQGETIPCISHAVVIEK